VCFCCCCLVFLKLYVAPTQQMSYGDFQSLLVEEYLRCPFVRQYWYKWNKIIKIDKTFKHKNQNCVTLSFKTPHKKYMKKYVQVCGGLIVITVFRKQIIFLWMFVCIGMSSYFFYINVFRKRYSFVTQILLCLCALSRDVINRIN
jgi:hypothetical protein